MKLEEVEEEVNRSTRARAHTRPRTRERTAGTPTTRNPAEIADARRVVARDHQLDDDLAAAVVAKMDNPRVDNIAALVNSEDGRARAGIIAAELTRAAEDAETHAEFQRRWASAELCEHDYKDFINPKTNEKFCPICRKRARAELVAAGPPAQSPQRPKRRRTA